MTHFVVIGLGSIGRRHARNLARLSPGARFTFVRRSATPDELSDQLGASVVDDLADVASDVSLAVLATPSADHAERLPELIERGWPLLVEKPIVADPADCDRIEALLESAVPAVRTSGFNLRYLPSLRRLREEIHGRRIGEVARASLVAGQWLPDWRPGSNYRSSYSAEASRGGGVELDLSHEFDMARWLFGDLSVASALGGRQSGLGLASNDTSVTILAPETGAGPTVSVSLDYVSRQPIRRYDVVGTLGSLTWSLDGTLELIGPEDRMSLADRAHDFEMADSYVRMMLAVFDAIATGSTEHVQSLSDGLASSRLAITARDLGSRK